ncbi:Rho GTPase-activating protein 1 [Linum perenne]
MEISWPSNVRHVAHVTFDRFNGFLGLPVEFEPDVPRKVPSVFVIVFFQVEGIFRISAENGQEENIRDQLNEGVVPEGVNLHCLAGLIKAWFRELPTGILDSLQTKQVIESETEEQCAELVRNLPPTESALLDWALNLMADVVEQEHANKMNTQSIATVFAPNMTQMDDPSSALMYAVQVMNFLKTLVTRTLRERQDSIVDSTPTSRLGPFDDESGHQSPSQSCSHTKQDESFSKGEQPAVERSCNMSTTSNDEHPTEISDEANDPNPNQPTASRIQDDQSSNSSPRKSSGETISEQHVLHLTPPQQSVLHLTSPVEKTCGISNLSRINSSTERIES